MKNHSKEYIERLTTVLENLDTKKLDLLKKKVQQLIGTNKTLFICGNGGSASTSSHMACDFSKTILGKNPRTNSKRLRVISLNDCIPTMTAWGNDEGYEHIFSEQLKSLGKKGDLLIVITGSGNSANILEVVKVAKKLGIESFGLLGFGGGKVKTLLTDALVVDSSDYGLVEDTHHIINHLITDYFKKIL